MVTLPLRSCDVYGQITKQREFDSRFVHHEALLLSSSAICHVSRTNRVVGAVGTRGYGQGDPRKQDL